jgi:hypothetical protein
MHDYISPFNAFCRGSLLSCEEKNKPYMFPQPQEFIFNMDLCRACEEKCVSHTVTGTKKQTETKTESSTQPFLWHSQNRHTHIKRENRKISLKYVVKRPEWFFNKPDD